MRGIAAIGLSAAMIAGPASATVVRYNFTGVITGESDAGGAFQPDLVGLPYSATFYVDYSKGYVSTTPSGTDRSGISGQDPLLEIGTFGGTEFDFGSGFAQGAYYDNGNDRGDLFTNFADPQRNPAAFIGPTASYQFRITTDGFNPNDFFYTIDFDSNINNQIRYLDPDTYTQDSLTLSPATLTISAAPVPEPASWSLMLAGFGVIGGSLRWTSRRRSFGSPAST